MSNSAKHIIGITVAGMLLFFPFLGSVHLFDWDEINFAESAREMLVSGNYFQVQIDFKPFPEKPPLFFWLQAISMKIFGINEFAARFPNAVFGIITLVTLYLFGKKYKNENYGIIWALCFGGSLLPFLYFKSGIIDPVFNYFIFTGIVSFFYTLKTNKTKYASISGSLIGLALLTKGPVGLLLFLLTTTIYLTLKKQWKLIKPKFVMSFTIAFLVSSFAWYGYELIQNGPWFIVEFIKVQIDLFSRPVAGHEQPFFYHFVVVFFGCFPMSIFALKPLSKPRKQKDFTQLMSILFWVVLILFSIVSTKIVHYSSMTYLPLSFLAANYIYSFVFENKKPSKSYLLTLKIIGSTLGLAISLFCLAPFFKEKIVPHIKDNTAKEVLELDVYWSGFEFLIGLSFIVLILFSVNKIKRAPKKGVSILFSGTAIFLFSLLTIIVPKIEKYSQASYVDFFESLDSEKVYADYFFGRSYADRFYFKIPQYKNKEIYDRDWRYKGDIDKPFYTVSKKNHKHFLDKNPEFEFLYSKGGYYFYVRHPKPIEN